MRRWRNGNALSAVKRDTLDGRALAASSRWRCLPLGAVMLRADWAAQALGPRGLDRDTASKRLLQAAPASRPWSASRLPSGGPAPLGRRDFRGAAGAGDAMMGAPFILPVIVAVLGLLGVFL